MSEAAPAVPRTSALAIWSLILGILGLMGLLVCIGFLFAIPAIICGHIALSRIKNSAGTMDGKGLAIGGLSTGYTTVAFSAAFIVAALLMMPSIAPLLDMTRSITTMTNVTMTSEAIKSYAEDHDDRLPPDLQTLVSDGYVAEEHITYTNAEGEEIPLEFMHPGAELSSLEPDTVILQATDAFLESNLIMTADGEIEVLDDGTESP